MKLEVMDDRCCFVCGMDNPEGLRIEWVVDGKTTYAQFIADRKYQGWKDMVHGGILATLLDEAMTRLACVVFGAVVTAEITVRFVHPAKIGETLTIRGEITAESRKLIEMKATVHAGNTLIAHSTGKGIRVKGSV